MNKLSPDLSRMMCDLLQHQSAPEVEIETFRDDSFLGVSLPFISVFKRSGGIEKAAYRKEIRVWPSLKNGDSAGYRRFYNFLI